MVLAQSTDRSCMSTTFFQDNLVQAFEVFHFLLLELKLRVVNSVLILWQNYKSQTIIKISWVTERFNFILSRFLLTITSTLVKLVSLSKREFLARQVSSGGLGLTNVILYKQNVSTLAQKHSLCTALKCWSSSVCSIYHLAFYLIVLNYKRTLS